jgi:DNA topoisomerase-2
MSNTKGRKIEEKYKKLTDIEHILLRPGMYISSIKPSTAPKWILKDGEMIKKEVCFINGFLKLFDEIITNSIDESKRPGTKLDTIKVNIKEGEISVWDNGGIEVVKHSEYDGWLPEMLFSETKAGSNFNEEDERTWSGTNGIGSVCVNIFSSKFIISTCDGKNQFTQTFSDNMTKKSEPKIKKSKINHTLISYLPDYARFGLTGIDESHFELIKKRVVDISGCNPNIKIFFNDEEIKIKSFEDYVKYYKSDYFYETNKDNTWSIAVAPSDDGFMGVSFVNTTETYEGGTHVDYILSQILIKMREFFQKKYKVDLKPSELKNHMMIFVNSTVINPSFSSQTKEKLITEVKDFGFSYEVSDKMIKSILKSEIVESVLDWINQKKKAENSKLERELNKSLSKIKVESLIDAKSKERWKCSLGIYEGLSAASSFRKYRDPQTMGAFSLKGKFINVSEITTKKLIENFEALNLMAALGLKIGEKIELKKLRYGRILLLTDADCDGDSISALILNFLNKYWPELFERKMVYKVQTPIVVVQSKKEKKKKILFYTQFDYNTWTKSENLQNWEIKYKKGLAALVDDEYDQIINSPKLTLITKDTLSDEYLDIWFGKNSELRKNQILNNN